MNNYNYMHSGADVRSLDGFHIGASDIPIILGLTKTTPYELWEQKKGLAEGFKGNLYTWWGHLHEGMIIFNHICNDCDKQTAHKFLVDYIRNMFYRGPGWKPKTQYHPFTECTHPEFPWMLAHADCVKNTDIIKCPNCGSNDIYDFDTKIECSNSCGFIIDPRLYRYKLIEAKSGSRFANMRKEDMDGYDPQDPTQSGLPMRVYVQVQWQQAVYDIQAADVCALIDTNNYMQFSTPGDIKIQVKLIEIGSRFMRCLVKDIPPTPKTFGDIGKLFPEIKNNRLTVMGEKAVIAWDIKDQLKAERKKKKKSQEKIDDYTNSLGLLMGDNKELADELGEKICSQSKYSTLTMIHPSTIKKECPEAFELLEKVGIIKKHDVRRIY